MTAPIPSTVSPIQSVLRQSQGQTILVSLQPSASQGVLLHVSPLLLFSDFLTLKMSAVVACCYTQPLYLHRCWGNTVLLKLPPDQFSPVTALLGPLLLPGAPAESPPRTVLLGGGAGSGACQLLLPTPSVLTRSWGGPSEDTSSPGPASLLCISEFKTPVNTPSCPHGTVWLYLRKW